MTQTYRFLSYASLIGLLILSGCGPSQRANELDAFMANPNIKAIPLEKLPPVMPPEVFSYEPGDIPDPFKPRNLKPKSGGGHQPDLTRAKDPLEMFPLDSLKMVGTIKKDAQLFALLLTPPPENTLYRVKKGEHVGINYGLITQITDTRIEIRETIQDSTGDWIESNATLAIQEEKK